MAAPAAVGVLCLLLNVQAEPQAAGRRHARLPPRRFPAERLVPDGFRGPNVLEKLAAGTQDENSAENLAFLIEHMGHAMKAQDAKTRRLREEGRAEQQQGGRRLAGEYKKITDSTVGRQPGLRRLLAARTDGQSSKSPTNQSLGMPLCRAAREASHMTKITAKEATAVMASPALQMRKQMKKG